MEWLICFIQQHYLQAEINSNYLLIASNKKNNMSYMKIKLWEYIYCFLIIKKSKSVFLDKGYSESVPSGMKIMLTYNNKPLFIENLKEPVDVSEEIELKAPLVIKGRLNFVLKMIYSWLNLWQFASSKTNKVILFAYKSRFILFTFRMYCRTYF